MKKTTAFLLIFFGTISVCFSQAMVTSVSYNKISEPGLMLELPYNTDVSEGFIVDNLKKIGYEPQTTGKLFWKNNKVNGFYTFKDVRLEGLDQSVDLYFKVEQKSRQEKDHSIIYMLIAKGENNFISSGSDEKTYNAAKNFLNGFVSQSATYKLNLDIDTQQKAIETDEKKLTKLQDSEKDLIKKIAQLQDDLKKNQQEQQSQQKTIENDKQKLAELKSKPSIKPSNK